MQIMTARQAAALIKSGSTVVSEGFLGLLVPDELYIALRERFLEEGAPRDLTWCHVAAQGDFGEKGMSRLVMDGFFRRIIGAHFNTMPAVRDAIANNEIAAYNFPQGAITSMFRDVAAKKPGTITRVGLKTFVDPRLEGGRLNQKAKDLGEDLVEVIEIEGQEYLRYKPLHFDACIIRGTYADENGNISLEKEGVSLNATAMTQAVRNCGGTVIVQVQEIVKAGALDPKLVKIPGIYVDAVVVSKPENHMQTYGTQYSPAYSGHITVPVTSIPPLPLDERKVIARRGAMELVKHAVVNLGVGMPEGVSIVANEEGIAHHMHLTVESGPVGGIPAGGKDFGAATNAEAILDSCYQFDFYDGGGLDVAFLGIGQCDKDGNINVSKFGPRAPGCGGFIDISQNSKKVVFCGNFTAGAELAVSDGKLTIVKEGKVKKFMNAVEQITFSGEYARSIHQPVKYITERAVFELRPDGLTLIEIAPGIDLQKDVLDRMDFVPLIAADLKEMDAKIFMAEPMGLTIQ